MNNIEECREEIDSIDNEILKLLAKRIEMSNKIGQIKRVANLPIHQPDRENALLENIKNQAQELGLPEEYVLELYKLILSQSRNAQSE
jgi:chorismate mutase/prephenate dehydratase